MVAQRLTVLLPWLRCTPTGDVGLDARSFLDGHDCHRFPRMAERCRRVGVENRRIAVLVGVDANRAEGPAWLHDLSAVIPISERTEEATDLSLEVLPDEVRYPLLFHQTLSEGDSLGGVRRGGRRHAERRRVPPDAAARRGRAR